MKNNRSRKYLERKKRVREFYRLLNDPNTKITLPDIEPMLTKLDKEIEFIYMPPLFITPLELE